MTVIFWMLVALWATSCIVTVVKYGGSHGFWAALSAVLADLFISGTLAARNLDWFCGALLLWSAISEMIRMDERRHGSLAMAVGSAVLNFGLCVALYAALWWVGDRIGVQPIVF